MNTIVCNCGEMGVIKLEHTRIGHHMLLLGSKFSHGQCSCLYVLCAIFAIECEKFPVSLDPSFIYSWSISNIWEHELYCLGVWVVWAIRAVREKFAKGQLISKCPFGVFKSPTKPTNFFRDFWPASEKRSKQKSSVRESK